MAEGQRMTVADVVAQVRDGRLEDFVREAVALVARELMEAEISAEVGAELGEIAPEARTTHRNGYRPRGWETRVGEIELLIPKKRSGPAYFPGFLEPRRRSEQAIVAVVLEAYVHGVSTRKVDRLVEQLGIDGMTKDRVSGLCRALDEQVQAFRQRPLDGAYLYLWLDAKMVKARDHRRVVSKAVVVAYAVHESGVREVIGLDIDEVESGAFWVEFLRGLKRRGLSGVRLAVSDQHQGLKVAIARGLACPWQRCTVHFTREMVMHCRRDQRGLVAAALREIFNTERELRAGQAARHKRARAPQGRGAEGVRPARGRRRGPARPLRFPARALDQPALHQPVGAGQQGDRAAHRRRRDLPQRPGGDPPGTASASLPGNKSSRISATSPRKEASGLPPA
jgi:putative transposase